MPPNAWASRNSKSLTKDGSDEPGGGASFKGQTRCNETHESTTDADARLYRKGRTASELRFMGHTLTDNRHGLIANAVVTTADGHAEREAAKAMIRDASQAAGDANAQITLGADKGYDAQEIIDACIEMKSRRMWRRTLQAGARPCPTPLHRQTATPSLSKRES